MLIAPEENTAFWWIEANYHFEGDDEEKGIDFTSTSTWRWRDSCRRYL